MAARPPASAAAAAAAALPAAARRVLRLLQRLLAAGMELLVAFRYAVFRLAGSVGGDPLSRELATHGVLQAAIAGDAPRLRCWLAAGGNPDCTGDTAVHWCPLRHAVNGGCAPCVAALLQAGADPNQRWHLGRGPLHMAAESGDVQCIAALLQSGADPAAPDDKGRTPLHSAAFGGHAAAARVLLAAEPHAAHAENWLGHTPLGVAILMERVEVAQCVAREGPPPPMLRTLGQLKWQGPWRMPLYATLAARQALTAEEWELVPVPCPGLSAALPAVLARSAQEASLLVRRLPEPERLWVQDPCLAARQPLTAADWQGVPAPLPGLGAALPIVLGRSDAEAALLVQHLLPQDAARLRTFALCLGRVQRVVGVQLPTPIVWDLLALSVA